LRVPQLRFCKAMGFNVYPCERAIVHARVPHPSFLRVRV
jgi:hypothetical protein